MSKRSSSGGDAKWLQQVRRSGTTSDKVAAMSVLVQDGAVANLHSLDGLLAMCSKKGGECISCRRCIAQASEREQPARCGAVCRQAAAACCSCLHSCCLPTVPVGLPADTAFDFVSSPPPLLLCVQARVPWWAVPWTLLKSCSPQCCCQTASSGSLSSSRWPRRRRGGRGSAASSTGCWRMGSRSGEAACLPSGAGGRGWAAVEVGVGSGAWALGWAALGAGCLLPAADSSSGTGQSWQSCQYSLPPSNRLFSLPLLSHSPSAGMLHLWKPWRPAAATTSNS